MTKLAEQIAPLDTPERRLYRLAVDLVRDRGPIGARAALRATVQREAELMDALLAHYCAGIARDIAGVGLLRSSRGGQVLAADDGQHDRAASRGLDVEALDEIGMTPPAGGTSLSGRIAVFERQLSRAASRAQNVDEGGQFTRASPEASPPMPPSSTRHDSGGAIRELPRGQSRRAAPLSPNACEQATASLPEGQSTAAPSQAPSAAGGADNRLSSDRPDTASPAASERDRAGRLTPVGEAGQRNCARPVAPNPPRGLAAIALAQNPADRALFDSYKVRGGRAIGDLTLGEARTIAATNEREARVLRELVSKIGFNPNPGAPLRDIIRPEWLRAALARNEESADACA